MNSLHHFSVTLQLRSPFLIAGTERPAWGVDVFQIRNAHGLPILPDSHLKGLLRHAVAASGAGSQSDRFGNEEKDDNHDKTGRLILSDLVAKGCSSLMAGEKVKRRTRVKIDDHTGTAARGHLLMVEEVAPLNTTVEFTGTALLWATSADVARAEAQELEAAFGLVAALGRFKSVGFGEVVGFAMEWTGEETGRAVDLPEADRFALTFGLSKPALVATQMADTNTSESSNVIPGAMIKGALARHLWFMGHDPSTGNLARALTTLMIGEATADKQTRRRDYDEVQLDDGAGSKWYRWDGAPRDAAIKFLPDVKNSDNLQAPFDYETRTRLAIDPDTQAARDGMLFSQRLIRPEYADQTPVVWRAQIDASACPVTTAEERAALNLVLGALMGGPATLGKTNARMTYLAASPLNAGDGLTTGATKVRVLLDTAALMLREEHLDTPATYRAAVREYWLHVTSGAYELALEADATPAIFARLSYRGGYEGRHYRFFGDDIVEPFVLTDAGSVFVLQATGAARPDVINALQRSGLPLVEWSGPTPRISAKGWADCPYTPENGYGAFTAEIVE